MSVPALRDFINRYNSASAGLAALAAVLDAKANNTPLESPLADRIDELLAVLGGGREMLADVGAEEARPLLAELRTMFALDAKLLHPQTRTIGWTYTDPAILQGAGATSAGFIQPLAKAVVPNLEGLADRLNAPGGAFLDVGVGVAGLAIAAARMWPSVRVVGIDPWQPSLAFARENVAKEGLGDRVELREQRAEDLPDDKAFDLAWIPAIFMPKAALRPASERVLRALRPGGWVLFNAAIPGGDPQGAALWRLRMTMFGDSALPAADVEVLLRDVGFADVRTLPSPPGALLCMVAARRKPA